MTREEIRFFRERVETVPDFILSSPLLFDLASIATGCLLIDFGVTNDPAEESLHELWNVHGWCFAFSAIRKLCSVRLVPCRARSFHSSHSAF